MTVHVSDPKDHGKGDAACARCRRLDIEGTAFPLRHERALFIGKGVFDGSVSHGGVTVEPCGGLIHVDAVQTKPYRRVTLALTCDGCDFNQKINARATR